MFGRLLAVHVWPKVADMMGDSTGTCITLGGLPDTELKGVIFEGSELFEYEDALEKLDTICEVDDCSKHCFRAFPSLIGPHLFGC